MEGEMFSKMAERSGMVEVIVGGKAQGSASDNDRSL